MKESPPEVLTMDDMSLRAQQIGLNLSILSEKLSGEIPNEAYDLNRRSALALNAMSRLWDVYIPVLDLMVDALLDLSKKAEEAAVAELHQKYENSQSLGNLKGERP